MIGTVKLAEKGPPENRLQIIRRNPPEMIVKSLSVGDYAVSEY